MSSIIAIILGVLLILFCLGLWFGVSCLIAKGIIFVMLSLFKINWTDKFWAVVVLTLIITYVFDLAFRNRKE